VSIEAEQIDREMVEMAIIPKHKPELGDEFNALATQEPQMLEWRRQTRNDAFLRNLFHNLTRCVSTSTFMIYTTNPLPAAWGTAMAETKPKRRWLRFSLRTLFVLVTIVGVGAGLYLHRLRIIKLEREKLAGVWIENGVRKLYLYKDQLDVGIPSDGIGQIDFHHTNPVTLPDGSSTTISRAIYQVNGDQIRFAQAMPGDPRPTKFEVSNEPKVFVFSVKRIADLNQEE
jgi:hypothetical protein